MKLQSLWRLTAPLLLVLMSCQAQADIIANVNVTSGQHWSDINGNFVQDDQPFTPFGGRLSSNLVARKILPCKPGKNTSAGHWSTCHFESDQSALASPYNDAYLARFSDAEAPGTELAAFLNVQDDGSFYADLTFILGKETFTEDDEASYFSSLNVNYQFFYSGTGMATTTKMDAALATWMWNELKPEWTQYDIDWRKETTDLHSGEVISVEQEGWQGTLELANAAVPEPGTPLLLLIGVCALAYNAKRRQRDRLAK
jgi:hypothetical protein